MSMHEYGQPMDKTLYTGICRDISTDKININF
jgi:hypothetical protein